MKRTFTIEKLKKYFHIQQNNFLAGFEVEFLFNERNIGWEWLSKQFENLHQDIEVDRDVSLRGRCNDDGMEIKTPPLPVKEAVILLNKVFQLVDKYGITNSTCGLHLNISPIDEKLYHAVNIVAFAQDKLFRDIKKYFKRTRNEFCYNVPKIKEKEIVPIKKFVETNNNKSYYYNLTNHYSVVNLGNLDVEKTSSSRIEIRAMGNKNYHRKFSKILEYTNRTLKTYLKYCAI